MTTAADNLRTTRLAAERNVHRAFHWLHLHEPQIRRWQMEVTAIPAPPFGEAARAAWFVERFHELGVANIALDDEGNVLGEIAPLSADTDAPCVLLSAHMDTVFPVDAWHAPSDDGARLSGPGICDNGAGLAALLAIAAATKFAELRPAATILLAANTGEEGEGDLRGMRHIFSAGAYCERLRAAIALEGSGSATTVDRALGSRRLRVTVAGPGGHSWANADQPNPIFALSNALAELSKLPLPTQPRTTLNCGFIRGGTSVNSVPESVSADLDLRSTSAEQLDETETTVLALLRGSVRDPRLTMRIELIGDRPTAALAADAPLMLALRSVDRHLHIATDLRIGSTDANLPLSLGIPALALGAGGKGGGIHTLGEWYEPKGRDLALRRILLLTLATAEIVAEEFTTV